MEQISINPEEMQWEEIAGFPPGTRISVLRRDQDGRIRTMLMKLGNDFSMGGHTNTTDEQQLVLEGEIQSGSETYSQGSYWFIPQRSSHESWRSDTGAILLVVWD